MSRLWLLPVLLLLGGCLPGVSPGRTPAETKTIVFPGGWIQGQWVKAWDGEFALAAAPLAADARDDVLGVLYPYSWLRYRSGQLLSDVHLPYKGRWLHARPQWIVGLERGLYDESDGWLDYPATDAVNTARGVFWVGKEALWRNREKLLEGSFVRVLYLDGRVLALEKNDAVFWPGEERIDLPEDWSKADAAEDLYLLTPKGVVRMTSSGFVVGQYPGSFEQIAVSQNGDVWLAKDNEVLHLNKYLEEAW